MALKTFMEWLENHDAQLTASKDIILSIFKNEIGINDDDVIMDTQLGSIEPKAWHNINKNGVFKTANPDIMQAMQNKSGTVRDLVNLMAGDSDSAPAALPGNP